MIYWVIPMLTVSKIVLVLRSVYHANDPTQSHIHNDLESAHPQHIGNGRLVHRHHGLMLEPYAYHLLTRVFLHICKPYSGDERLLLLAYKNNLHKTNESRIARIDQIGRAHV